MKTSYSISALFACFLIAISGLMAPNLAFAGMLNSPALKKKVEQVCSDLEAAYKTGNMAKVAAMYDDEATLILSSGEKLQGRKAIYDYLASQGAAANLKIEIIEVGGTGDMIYHVGKATFTRTENGRPLSDASDFVMLWKKQADWSYKIYVESSN